MRYRKVEAEAYFNREFSPANKNDKPAQRQAWNNFTDMLNRDGMITDSQYDRWEAPKNIQ